MHIKKHIPNLLTLGNLFCGCLAIIEILQNKSIEKACYLMVLALIFDFFDGFLARLLKVSSPIGKELDSLADMVTFGALPAFILQFLMITYANMALQSSYFAFLIALFSALRLANFNIDTRQNDSFIGVPTPANAIFIASIAYLVSLNSSDFLEKVVSNPINLIVLTIILSYLLVAELPLFAFKFKHFGLKGNEIRYGFIVLILILVLFFKILAIPVVICLYIFISILIFFLKKI